MVQSNWCKDGRFEQAQIEDATAKQAVQLLGNVDGFVYLSLKPLSGWGLCSRQVTSLRQVQTVIGTHFYPW